MSEKAASSSLNHDNVFHENEEFYNSNDVIGDIYMAFDGRGDSKGPANSGFIYLRSNCKIKIFTDTLVHYIGLVLIGRSDQRHWNLFLREYDFRLVNFRQIIKKYSQKKKKSLIEVFYEFFFFF